MFVRRLHFVGAGLAPQRSSPPPGEDYGHLQSFCSLLVPLSSCPLTDSTKFVPGLSGECAECEDQRPGISAARPHLRHAGHRLADQRLREHACRTTVVASVPSDFRCRFRALRKSLGMPDNFALASLFGSGATLLNESRSRLSSVSSTCQTKQRILGLHEKSCCIFRRHRTSSERH